MSKTIEQFTTRTGDIAVRTPYNPDAAKGLRNLGGRWDANAKVWIVPARVQEALDELLIDLFNQTGRADEKTTIVRIRALTRMSSCRKAVDWNGRPIAQAWGRDTGAKTCQGVSMLSGSISSGGSVKNWYSIVAEGSVFEIVGAPANPQPEAGYWELVSVEEEGGDTRRKELDAERARLVARLAEIDAALAPEQQAAA